MLGYYAHYSQYYITVLMLTTTLFFALPIFVAPITWARLMGWTIPEHQHLAIYFGRCLGAFILVIEVAMLRSATTGTSFSYAFDLLFRSCRPHENRALGHGIFLWALQLLAPASFSRHWQHSQG